MVKPTEALCEVVGTVLIHVNELAPSITRTGITNAVVGIRSRSRLIVLLDSICRLSDVAGERS